MIDNDFLKHDELDPKQETRNQLLRGRISGACGAAVVVKTCMAKILNSEQACVLERGKLVQLYSCHDRVRVVVFHEKNCQVPLILFVLITRKRFRNSGNSVMSLRSILCCKI